MPKHPADVLQTMPVSTTRYVQLAAAAVFLVRNKKLAVSRVMSTNTPAHSRETRTHCTHCFDVNGRRGQNMTVSRRITSDINVITDGQLPPALRHSCRPRRRGQLKCDGTRAETRFRLSAKWTSPFKSAAGASVQSTTGSRGVRISGSNAGYTMFRGSVKGIGYPLHSPVSPSLSLPCVTVCHHISTAV